MKNLYDYKLAMVVSFSLSVYKVKTLNVKSVRASINVSVWYKNWYKICQSFY